MCVMYVCALIEGDLVRGNQQIYFDLLNLHSMTDTFGTGLVEECDCGICCIMFDFGLQMAVLETSDCRVPIMCVKLFAVAWVF